MFIGNTVKKAVRKLKTKLVTHNNRFIKKIFGIGSTKLTFGIGVLADCQYNCAGENNEIAIGKGTKFLSGKIFIFGDGNSIIIGKNCNLKNTVPLD